MNRVTRLAIAGATTMALSVTTVFASPAAIAVSPSPVTNAADDQTAAALHSWKNVTFSDDFTGNKVDSKKWHVATDHDEKGTTWSPKAASVDHGVLTLTGNANSVSAHLDIANPYAQQYGRWEVRARMPKGGGYDPGMFLWPAGAPGREYDFAENMDNSRQSISAFVHIGEKKTLQQAKKIDTTQWHNYAVEWSADHLVFYIDGNEWYRVNDKDAAKSGKMALMLELYRWKPNGPAKLTTFDIDWARVYSL